MNKSELAKIMLVWEVKRIELDEIEKTIQDEVMPMKDNFVVGNVRAVYSDGKRTFDYETAGKNAPVETIAEFTGPKTDWKKVCESAEIKEIPFTKTDPSVKIQIK